MEDDIDIEEHDVLDNPKIKSIFPDLSCVKMEIPDEDEIEDQYEDMAEDCQESSMQYQYEYSFQTTEEEDEIEEDGEPNAEEYEEDSEGYLYHNQIILGSKPPADPEVLYQEALNSKPIVYLEDWGFNLKNNPCFCQNCNILFSTVNALDAHKMIAHSFLVALDIPHKNTARKSTVTSKFCNHCSKTFPDDTSLIKHLYELLPINNFPKPEVSPSCKYRCQKCKKVFNSYNAGKYHKEHVHPNLKHVHNLIIKIRPTIKTEDESAIATPNIVKIEPKVPKIEPKIVPKIEPKTVPKLEAKLDSRTQLNEWKLSEKTYLVPKTALFQCNTCRTCFVSCFPAIQHQNHCTKGIPHQKCSICKRKIRLKDVKIHNLQHHYNDKLKIYTIRKSIYEKVLCKCPKCESCFDELFFWNHIKNCNHEESKYCPECNVNIIAARYETHRNRHKSKKYTKKDYIIVEYYEYDFNKKSSQKKTVRQYRRRLFASTEKKLIVYHCIFCGCSMHNQTNLHATGECVNSNIDKRFCEKCGLTATAKIMYKHAILHKTHNFTLKDVKFLNLQTGNEIDAPIAQMYECEKCEMQFIWRKMLLQHDCGNEDHVVCKTCNKKFSHPAFKVHRNFHPNFIPIPSQSQSQSQNGLTELIKKYNSINNMWNVVYQCTSCEVVTVRYDVAVEHAQSHINSLLKLDRNKRCDICQFYLTGKDYAIHRQLHLNNGKIKRSSFKVLSFNHEDLFKDEWMDMFNDLPEGHREQILAKSAHRCTRNVKLHVRRNVSRDDAKFLCMNCKEFVEQTNIPQHQLCRCPKSTIFRCQTCFSILKSRRTFIMHHETHDVNKKYKIVTFNFEFDREFNEKLVAFENLTNKGKKKTVKVIPEVSNSEVLTTKKKYKIYKCAKCLCCVFMQHSMQRHNCIPLNHRKKCKVCDQLFSFRKMWSHMEAHKKRPYITKETLAVIYFNQPEKTKQKKIKIDKAKTPKLKPQLPETDRPKSRDTVEKSPDNLIANIFKCECGLHFTSMKTVQTHLDVCNPDLDVPQERCGQCQLLFPTELLVNHLCNHHSKGMKITVEKIKKINLIKCIQCLLLFKNNDSFYQHASECSPKNGRKCKDCNLIFDKLCFDNHDCSVKDKTTYINKIIKKSPKLYTLFTCKRCNIYYLSYKAYSYHIQTQHKFKISVLTCEYCELRFTKTSLNRHLPIHRNGDEEYKIKVIDRFNGTTEVLTGKNTKVDELKAVKRKLEKLELRTYSKRVKISSTAERSSSRLSAMNKSADETKNVGDDVTDNISNSTAESLDQDDSKVSDAIKNRINICNYNDNLYKCIYCEQHFMFAKSLEYHIKVYYKHDNTSENHKCDICDLDFSSRTLPRHKYVHHDIMKLKKDDFVIFTETPYTRDRRVYSKIDAAIKKDKKNKRKVVNDVSNKEVIEENNDYETENDEKVEENTENVNKNTTVCENSSETNKNNDISSGSEDEITDTNSETPENNSELKNNSDITNNSEKITYYKCASCNVCFLNHSLCLNHTLNHITMDSKLYIQCKICEFQFTIDSLKEHMDVHHNVDFKIENLTIEEYRPLDGVEPKIDSYQAIDKVQSRLISTTTDVGIV